MSTNEPPPFELYNGSRQYRNFCRLIKLFPHSIMTPPPVPFEFAEGPSIALPEHFLFRWTSPQNCRPSF